MHSSFTIARHHPNPSSAFHTPLPPTPNTKPRIAPQIYHTHLLLPLPARLKQTYTPILNLDHRAAPRVAHALLHAAPISQHNVPRARHLLAPLHNRLEPFDPVRHGRHVRGTRLGSDFRGRQMREPRHAYDDERILPNGRGVAGGGERTRGHGRQRRGGKFVI